jgi:hypothetical protein
VPVRILSYTQAVEAGLPCMKKQLFGINCWSKALNERRHLFDTSLPILDALQKNKFFAG